MMVSAGMMMDPAPACSPSTTTTTNQGKKKKWADRGALMSNGLENVIRLGNTPYYIEKKEDI